jgi:hypothetical protein
MNRRRVRVYPAWILLQSAAAILTGMACASAILASVWYLGWWTILVAPPVVAAAIFMAFVISGQVGDFRRFFLPAARTARFSARNLTDFAALVAGDRGPALRDEWRAHLAGESGHDPATWPKVRQALGFVASAIRFRLADTADLAWRPADAVLCSRTLSNLFVAAPVIAMLFAIVHHDGGFGLVADIQDSAALGGFLYGVIRTGRWWRGVKPPEPKARRVRD